MADRDLSTVDLCDSTALSWQIKINMTIYYAISCTQKLLTYALTYLHAVARKNENDTQREHYATYTVYRTRT